MSSLPSALQRYIQMRRGLGHKFQLQERRLMDFVAFMEKHGATVITRKLALEWATLPPDRHSSWALRLCDVRGFARHLINKYRAAHGGTATEDAPAPPSRQALHLQRGGDPKSAGRGAGSTTSQWVAPMDLLQPVRTSRCGRVAHQRSALDAARRCRPGAGYPHNPRHKVRQVSPRAASPHDAGSPAPVCSAPRRTSRPAEQPLFLRH